MKMQYPRWVTLAVWRKKSTLLALALGTLIFIICLQYNTARPLEGDESELGKVGGVQDKRTLLGGSAVQYVVNPQPVAATQAPQESPEKVVEDSPYRDDLGASRNDRPDGSVFDDMPSRAPYIPKQRLIHLDLKGAPPKVSYLKKILKLSKEMGATGVLLEYEDMFPWSGHLKNIAATNAYTKDEVKEVLEAAKQSDLEVIPLIQTFGHVEFALKLQDYKHLREVPESAQALCPSLNSSIDFITLMVEQVMELHPDVNYLHIGCDEVFQMGECSRCKTQPRDSLFLGHVAKVANIVKSRYPKVTPIIWDDMLRHLPPSSLEQFRIGELVEPMVWVYAEDVYRFVPLPIWEKYAAVFPTVWTASAFKGAFGETLYIPNVKRHLDNNLRWLEVMSNEAPKFKNGFQGIVITGWQRYDHFSVLCELLPAAIPSLAITLLATTHGYMNASLRTKINNHLNCGIFAPTSYFNLNSDPYLWDTYSRCTFPGNAFFKLTSRLSLAQKEAEELITMIRQQKGWMTKYNVRHNFSTPLRVDELMQDQPRVYHTVASLARSARDALADVFDIVTISEWVEQNIYPTVVALEEIQRDANALKARRVWPRRPFPPLKDLTRLGVSDSDDDDIQEHPG